MILDVNKHQNSKWRIPIANFWFGPKLGRKYPEMFKPTLLVALLSIDYRVAFVVRLQFGTKLEWWTAFWEEWAEKEKSERGNLSVYSASCLLQAVVDLQEMTKADDADEKKNALFSLLLPCLPLGHSSIFILSLRTFLIRLALFSACSKKRFSVFLSSGIPLPIYPCFPTPPFACCERIAKIEISSSLNNWIKKSF